MDSLSKQNICPFPGLRPFNEEESIFFKGRDKHIEEVTQQLEVKKFLMLTGASGDGKSSLVFAGLVPNIKAGFFKAAFNSWAIASFRPGNNPLQNMARAISGAFHFQDETLIQSSLSHGFSALIDLYKNSLLYVDKESDNYLLSSVERQKKLEKQSKNLLIIVDQFEELFTHQKNYNRETGIPSENAQVAVNLLLETTKLARSLKLPIYVICTMRSDYIGSAPAFRGLPEMVGANQFFVPRLNRDEIEQAILEPIKLSGNKISLRLVQRLLNDLHINLDILPVLQHCLHQCWHVAILGMEEIDLLHYAKVGGISRAELPEIYHNRFDQWFAALPDFKRKHYENPGFANVLNLHANELYESTWNLYIAEHPHSSLSKEQVQKVIATTFKCLTKIDDHKAVRNRMTLGEMVEIIDMNGLSLEILNDIILLFRQQGNTLIFPYVVEGKNKQLKSSTVLEITHEALIRNWSLLNSWVQEEMESATVFRDLSAHMVRWKEQNCAKEYLLQIGSHAFFLNWYDKQKPNPTWVNRYWGKSKVKSLTIESKKQSVSTANPKNTETEPETNNEFDTAIILHCEDLKLFLDKSHKILRKKRRIRELIGGLAILFLISLFAFLWANSERSGALLLKNNIEVQKKSIEIATKGYRILQKNPTLAFRLGEKAFNIYPSPLAKEVIMTAYGEAPFYYELPEHKAGVMVAKYSMDGKWILTASQDNVIRIWDHNYELKNTFVHKDLFVKPHLRPDAVNFASDPKFIISAGDDSTARLWNNKGFCLATMKHQDKVNAVVYAPDYNKILTASDDCTSIVWNLRGEKLKILKGHKGQILSAKYSTDGSRILTSSRDQSVIVWDSTGKLLYRCVGHTGIISSANFSNNGHILVTSSLDKTARVWDKEGRLKVVLKGHTAGLRKAIFSPDDRYILTASRDNTIRMWDLSGNVVRIFEGHSSPVWDLQFSKSGSLFISASDDATARIWNLLGNESMVLKGHDGQILCAQISPDENEALTASIDYTAKVWKIKNFEKPYTNSHLNYVFRVDYSPSGNHFLTAGWDGVVYVWDKNIELVGSLKDHDFFVIRQAAFINDTMLYSSSAFGEINLWSLDGKLLNVIQDAKNPNTPNKHIEYNKFQKIILAVRRDVPKINIWNIDGYLIQELEDCIFGTLNIEGNLLSTINVDSSYTVWKLSSDSISKDMYQKKFSGKIRNGISDLTISHNTNILAAAVGDSTIMLIDSNAQIISKLIMKSKIRNGLRFSPDDNFLLAPVGKKAGLYNLKTQKLTFLKGHDKPVSSIKFSNNGELIVTSSIDNTVRIWNLNGKELQIFSSHKNNVVEVVFSPDDKKILSSSYDHTARIMPISVEIALEKINKEKVRGRVQVLSTSDID